MNDCYHTNDRERERERISTPKNNDIRQKEREREREQRSEVAWEYVLKGVTTLNVFIFVTRRKQKAKKPIVF